MTHIRRGGTHLPSAQLSAACYSVLWFTWEEDGGRETKDRNTEMMFSFKHVILFAMLNFT